GPVGEVGPTGPTGPMGPAGTGGSSTIIPLSSGFPVSLTTVLGGAVSTQAAVGFGGNGPITKVLGANIDLSGGGGLAINQAFSSPRNGTITGIAAYFSISVASALSSSITITARIYQATPPSNTFKEVGTLVLPSISAFAAIGVHVSD